eukprot:CAMPEP_0183295044 /NCGR_PEP_ID=MMETSP0160_2-20130417/3153_1 /TAXON_ID=2839 ORGANISM="Odontella Sinensis, Strain Grunow 1884" /NCGR_SAMPLE_ID=MMETSP0160_2 /ASSEMBLY_ACC=CAM_ASM_000250 /LENGTH=270 /DNA_ID=CAMNT_0025456461 /DNA_START=42 /DNA_END=854 /DNA_ORIENTATION=+
MRMIAPSFFPIATSLIAAAIDPASAAVSSSSIRYCNRGYCYTRREPEHHHGLDHDLLHRLAGGNGGSAGERPHKKRTGLDFCTDTHGQVMDCELFNILGLNPEEVESEAEALEARGAGQSGIGDRRRRRNAPEEEEIPPEETPKPGEGGAMPAQDDGTIDVDGEKFDSPRVSGHVSWKDRPNRGKCIDNDAGYVFDCNLVKILDDGLVLIEDLRLGGTFAAQPKSGYHVRRKRSNMAEVRTPDVLHGSGTWDTDPTEDFRTNAMLNLEGM